MTQDKQEVIKSIKKVWREYLDNDKLDWQDPNKEEYTTEYLFYRLEQELRINVRE